MITKDFILALNGKPIKESGEELRVNETIAAILFNGRSKDSLRSIEIAMRLYKGENFELSDSEQSFITERLKEAQGVPDGIIAQLLLAVKD